MLIKTDGERIPHRLVHLYKFHLAEQRVLKKSEDISQYFVYFNIYFTETKQSPGIAIVTENPGQDI